MKNQNRRNFLKAGALLSTGIFASSALATETNSANAATANTIGDTVKKRKLGTGKHSLDVSALGLGCMGMSYHRSFIPDPKAMVKVLRQAAELGINFFDTAEVYGPFTNEALVGEALAPIRKDILICSKFGFNIENGKMNGLDSKPSHIRAVVEQSLTRLKTDYIDLLYQHRVDPNVQIEEVAGTVKDLIQEGKVLHFGLSEANDETIRKAHAVQPLTALQSEYSLMTRDPENKVIETCEELGIGFVPYSPISRGLITGYINERTRYNAANDNRPTLPRYQPETVIANWPLIELLSGFGNQRGLTVAQVALAWLLSQKPFIVPIPGSTKLAHIQENLGAANYEFSAEELTKFNTDLEKITIAGARN